MIGSLGVVIVNWRKEELTLRCVAMVRGWSTLKPRVVVVDNQSNEQSQKALGKSLSLNEFLRSQTNLGYAGGNNLGIREVLQGRPAFVLLLNNDAQVTEGSICQLLKRFEQNPDVAILGPVIKDHHSGDVRLQV